MNAIVLSGVSKHFKKNTIRREYTTLKSELVRFLKRQKRKDPPASTIQALHDISLTVAKGQTFGLVGRNGAGKSTLLKLITGIYAPTTGTVEVNGRISALLELGAGFHPDFSGRENILINGVILGMTRKEIRARMDEIIEFSELGDFIDEPVRTYSSGMYMRLAFAVATHVDPEILIIDEILAVGDEHFSRKSKAKLAEFREKGKTMFLVTHDLGSLQRYCDQAAWIDGGRIRAIDEPATIVAEYRHAVQESEAVQEARALERDSSVRQPRSGPPAEPGRRWGSFAVELEEARVLDASGTPRPFVKPGEPFSLALRARAFEPVGLTKVELRVTRADGLLLWKTSSPPFHPQVGVAHSMRLALPRLGLAGGDYWLNLAVVDEQGDSFDTQRELHRLAIAGASDEPVLLAPQFTWEDADEAASPPGRVMVR